jgi:hypothetical protein
MGTSFGFFPCNEPKSDVNPQEVAIKHIQGKTGQNDTRGIYEYGIDHPCGWYGIADEFGHTQGSA